MLVITISNRFIVYYLNVPITTTQTGSLFLERRLLIQGAFFFDGPGRPGAGFVT